MSAMTSMFTPAAVPIARLIFAAVDAVLLGLKQLVRAYRNRGEAAVLAGLDDRALADMGLTRSDLRDAFAGPLWRDPTNLLRARALERRLSRRGISLGFDSGSVPAPPPGFTRPRTDRAPRLTV